MISLDYYFPLITWIWQKSNPKTLRTLARSLRGVLPKIEASYCSWYQELYTITMMNEMKQSHQLTNLFKCTEP